MSPSPRGRHSTYHLWLLLGTRTGSRNGCLGHRLAEHCSPQLEPSPLQALQLFEGRTVSYPSISYPLSHLSYSVSKVIAAWLASLALV